MKRTKFAFKVHAKDVRLVITRSTYTFGVTANLDTAFGDDWDKEHIDQVEDLLLSLVEILDLSDVKVAERCLHGFLETAFSEEYNVEEG